MSSGLVWIILYCWMGRHNIIIQAAQYHSWAVVLPFCGHKVLYIGGSSSSCSQVWHINFQVPLWEPQSPWMEINLPIHGYTTVHTPILWTRGPINGNSSSQSWVWHIYIPTFKLWKSHFGNPNPYEWEWIFPFMGIAQCAIPIFVNTRSYKWE